MLQYIRQHVSFDEQPKIYGDYDGLILYFALEDHVDCKIHIINEYLHCEEYAYDHRSPRCSYAETWYQT